MGYDDDDPRREDFHRKLEMGFWDTDNTTYVVVPQQPDDDVLVRAFDRGRSAGQNQTKYGHTQAPSPNKPWIYDAWMAGYQFGFKEGKDDESR